MRSSTLLSSLALGFGSFTAAQTCNHKAVGSTPAGNPTIAPAVGEQVTPGKPFKITWTVRLPCVLFSSELLTRILEYYRR